MTDDSGQPGRALAAGLHPAGAALLSQLYVLLHWAGIDRPVIAGYEGWLTLLTLAVWACAGFLLARRSMRAAAGFAFGSVLATFILLACANWNNGAFAPPLESTALDPVSWRELFAAIGIGAAAGLLRGGLLRPERAAAALFLEAPALALLGALGLRIPYATSPLVASPTGWAIVIALAFAGGAVLFFAERRLAPPPRALLLVLPAVCIVVSLASMALARPIEPAPIPEGAPAPPADRPDVVLIVLDTARAARMSLYGAGRPTTPALQRLAEGATRFDAAYSTACWTLPSHASLFTGLYPPEHGAHWGNLLLGEGNVTLAERMQSAGYRTAAFSANPWVTREGGFGQGFDFFLERPSERRPWRPWQLAFFPVFARLAGERFAFEDAGGEIEISFAAQWMAGQPGTPHFTFINMMEAHIPYAPPGRFRREFAGGWTDEALRALDQNLVIDLSPGRAPRPEEEWEGLRDLYDGEIAYLDHLVGRLVRFLEASGRLDRTLLIVTSDHGENLGDHLPLDHQLGLWETLIHVPLVVRWPGGGHDEVRRDLVSLVDIAPTVLAAAGIPADGPLAGRPGLTVSDVRAEIFADYHMADSYLGVIRSKGKFDPAPWNRSLSAMRAGGRKLIAGSDGTTLCFDPAADPLEKAPLPAAECGALAHRLESWRAALLPPPPAPVDGEMSEDRKRALQGLGYIP